MPQQSVEEFIDATRQELSLFATLDHPHILRGNFKNPLVCTRTSFQVPGQIGQHPVAVSIPLTDEARVRPGGREARGSGHSNILKNR